MTKGSPSRVYEIRTRFRAPLPFVFAWCTDYSANDPRLEKERYTRRIVRRSTRQVVYEDLTEAPRGWMWSRHTVTLQPPNRWHSDSLGSHRTWSLDYALRELPSGGTELTLRGVRRPTSIGGPNPPKAELERELRRSWKNFGAELEKDFRSGRARSRRAPTRRRAR